MRRLSQAVSAFFGDFVSWLRDVIRPRPELRDGMLTANLRRLAIICAVGIPVSAAHVVLFWLDAPRATPAQADWRLGIIVAHCAMAALEAVFLIAAYRMLRRPRGRLGPYVAQFSAIAAVVFFGAAITAVDQLVTPNMTPFLVAAILVAVVFIMHPLPALTVYTGAFVLFYWAVGLVRTDEAVVLSNRVNGLTAVALGFSLAMMLWTSYLRRAQQQLHIADQQARLQALATVDPLTGVLNRRRFEEAVATEVARLGRSHDESCLLLMDMDHFKAINDRFGHPVGDQVLRFVAALLQQNLRRYDVLARWGGEEFIMLFPGTSLAAGREIAEKLRRAIEHADFDAGGEPVGLSASFGLVALGTTGPGAFAETYARADKALYAAKDQGRNRVEIDHGASI
ncbi:GGDEF domain-containing protein [Ectothiorhodospiraceae bacterium WFHF3C12]|nr:GGDEF domain-containing protein [Ectothiorhodospiraceae bacterium WFHF3C12]